MVRGWFGAALVAALLPLASPAQQQPLPEELRQGYRAELLRLRDSVAAVAAAAVGFNRDLGTAGPETVLSRARALAEGCRAAQRVLRNGEAVLAPAAAHERAGTNAFLRAAQRLRTALREECEQIFAPPGGAVADTLRAWAGYRTARIARAVEEYELAAQRFAAALQIRLDPNIPRASGGRLSTTPHRVENSPKSLG